jgi:calcineurin-like phosphoesterase family protein
MMKLFFTSDQHFGHANIIKHCKRPFSDVREMNDYMIMKWNSVIGKNDTVIHLGDFAYKSAGLDVHSIFRTLNGKKHLVVGNHDDRRVLDLGWESVRRDYFLKTTLGSERVEVHGYHYPLLEWNGFYRGAYHLYGHVHGTLRPSCWGRAMDMSVDCHDYTPKTIEQIVSELRSVDSAKQRALEFDIGTNVVVRDEPSTVDTNH